MDGWTTRQTDGWTDGQTDDRQKNDHFSSGELIKWRKV